MFIPISKHYDVIRCDFINSSSIPKPVDEVWFPKHLHSVPVSIILEAYEM